MTAGTSGLLEAVGERIRARRERLGMTQRDVANGLHLIGDAHYAHMDVIGQAVFGAFIAERFAAKNTESHVAATAAVVGGRARGLGEPVRAT